MDYGIMATKTCSITLTHIGAEFHNNATSRFAADGHIEKDLGVGPDRIQT
jgi:hypothetical protein